MSPDAHPGPVQRPHIPPASEVVTTESFGQLALAAASQRGRWLVLTPLLASGISTGDLFVASLPEQVDQRDELLIFWMIYLTITVPGWTHLAYAVVEQHPEGTAAMVVIVPRHGG